MTASPVGIDRAEKSLLRQGFESKSNFAKTQLIGKSTVDKFFNRQPIQLDTFKRICKALKIEDWRSVAELESLVAQCELEAAGEEVELDVAEAIASQPTAMNLTAARRITVANRENGKVQFEIVLKGDIASIDDQVQKTLETIFRSLLGSSITITDIQAGSIRIKLQGSPEDFARLIDRLTSGELIEINGFPVENIQILSQSFLEEVEESSSNNKWDLVQEIISRPLPGRQVSGADLSDADLSGADLRDADLSGADLSDADLSGADLRNALDLALNRALRDAHALRDAVNHALALKRDRPLNLYLTLNLNRTLNRALDLALDLDHTRAFNLDRALKRALERDIALDRDLNFALDRDLNFALDRALTRKRDLTRNLAHARDLNFALDRTRTRNTNLKGANLGGAIVEHTLFGKGIGLTQAEKLDLEQRGAIFSDSTGDREFILR
ncbi:pentapeptide repeat-containing protein [Trichocoleus sp. FACHB-262]|uniref:pentapeptide repeat-containing protein n=1 Tax=Trichocoleus sp. FACHB-262 TaxID=2692869 RepID=UPI0028C4DA06|nr:pentapeptide repeat-containing protein [Trichocoleus sp. FACHB-262]